jgi:hypothetical protein
MVAALKRPPHGLGLRTSPQPEKKFFSKALMPAFSGDKSDDFVNSRQVCFPAVQWTARSEPANLVPSYRNISPSRSEVQDQNLDAYFREGTFRNSRKI